jgi:diketogulonate reductase-like aldo/keto reductase
MTLSINSIVRLNSGEEMPVIGLGVWQIPDGNVRNAVKWALDAGYRHIDTAFIYHNESGVGDAIAESRIPREELFVTTKLWNADQGIEETPQAFQHSLENLKLDYIDLYLMHFPSFVELEETSSPPNRELKLEIKRRRREAWLAMERILRSGLVKSIGVSNFTEKHLRELSEYATFKPAVNQVEFHPFLYQRDLLNFCESEGIQLEAYSPLTSGYMLNDQRITDIAEKYGKSNAQVLIRWSLQHNLVVIPKSIHESRIRENVAVFDFELADEDMEILDNFEDQRRTCINPELIP